MQRVAGFFILATLAAAQTREKRIVPIDASARQTFETQRKVALLVGIGAYPEASGLSSLKYAAQDVAELAAQLENQGYSVRQLTDSQATRGIVVRTLNQLGQAIDPNQGTFLFYFSGHGFAQDRVNYLATYGVAVDDLKRDGLALTEVEDLIRKTRAKRQVLWIDACRNDPQSGARDVSRRGFAHLEAAEGLRVLYSTREGFVSYEDDSLRHGVFTYFLLRGLRGEAAGADGLVTFQDLAGYVADAVTDYGIKTGRVQRPFDAGEASGDFLLVKTEVSAPATTLAPVGANPVVPAPPVHAPTAAANIGEIKVNPKDNLKYVRIPAGKFTMGCSPDDTECHRDEKPAHEVFITKPFWIGQTEVTQAAYLRVTGQNPSRHTGDNFPVEMVTWSDAQRYCRAIGGRLPTEAEWEYVARAGSPAGRYADLEAVAWYSGNSGNLTHEAGTKLPNAWGLYDTLGNVMEWTADWHDFYSSGTVTDPTGPTDGGSRMVRGGSQGNDPGMVRVSSRDWLGPGVRSPNIGMRCVWE